MTLIQLDSLPNLELQTQNTGFIVQPLNFIFFLLITSVLNKFLAFKKKKSMLSMRTAKKRKSKQFTKEDKLLRGGTEECLDLHDFQ